jgi:hopene-associated glycosyltransferase HpnB
VIALFLALFAFAAWLFLLCARDGFWLARERDNGEALPEPAHWPTVTAIVPARDEADVIGASIASLLAQDYPGPFHVILIDDGSCDGTTDIAHGLHGLDRLTILRGEPLAPGWTGKLWAVVQGIEAAGSDADWFLLTDADITHTPDHARRLVSRGVRDGRVLVSVMARLRCVSFAERMLIPAFVFFFQMLYPFARVNRTTSKLGAAAGGCMLVRREALARAGGIATLRGALIDDCAFGALLKRQGPVWLGLSDKANSIRRYDSFGSVAAMISRSAYAQLGYSPLMLAGTILGLAILYAAPPALTVMGEGAARMAAVAAWVLMAIMFQPMLRFYRRSPLWGPALPLIAAFYAGCTVLSAWQHMRGRGGMWKGRAQAALQP